MKALFSLILILSTIIYSQENFNSDQVVSLSGLSDKGLITYLDNNYVVFMSENNGSSKFFLNTLNEIEIKNLGNVYSESSGYSLSLDSLETFLIERNDSILSSDETFIPNYGDKKSFNGNKKFFFAIHYFPTITKQLLLAYNFSPYSYLGSRYQPTYIELEQNLISMESQLGYNITKNLFITISLGYSSDLYKSSSTNTNINPYDQPSQTTHTSKTETQNSLDKFVFEFGIKHYYGNFEVNNVNPFVTLSAGKQFAFVDNYSNNYSDDQNYDYVTTNNANEFLEDLSSPFFVSVGFGAEYAISKSLSLSGMVKLKYNMASSEYKSKTIDNGVIVNQINQNVENKNVTFKTGLGLSFFF